MTAPRIVGYTYEADCHCVKHTQQRFGRNPEGSIDGEGNPIYAVLSGTADAQDFHCSECIYVKVQRRCARQQKAAKR